jgi:hypothetical protein
MTWRELYGSSYSLPYIVVVVVVVVKMVYSSGSLFWPSGCQCYKLKLTKMKCTENSIQDTILLLLFLVIM